MRGVAQSQRAGFMDCVTYQLKVRRPFVPRASRPLSRERPAPAGSCGMAILAMAGHGRDAHGTFACGMAILAIMGQGRDALVWPLAL
jgi:hypothetical protein